MTVRNPQTKVLLSKGWLSLGSYLTYYHWVLEYHSSLQANDALDSLNDHLKIEGESCPYEVR